MPETDPIRPGQVTYGDLFETTCDAVWTAVLLPHRQGLEPDQAQAELLGHHQFLRTSGLHLSLLARFHPVTDEQRHLVGRLTALPVTDAPRPEVPGNWLRAARALGAAHDLLATHLDTSHQPRTAESEDLLSPASALGPTRALTELVLDAVNASEPLANAASRAQKGIRPHPIPQSQLNGLRRWASTLLPYAKAAHLDASQTGRTGSSWALSSLEPAPVVTSAAFESEFQALRVLSQLTYGQGRGRVPASPTSLRDLALLAITVTDPDLDWLPQPATGLQRLDRAQVHDHVEAAHACWSGAAEDLTHSFLGTTRAPGLYGTVIQRLRRSDSHGLGIRMAILSALPRLGRDAAAAVTGLQDTHALVEKTREPGRLTMVWRPIPPAQAHELSARFREAASSSEAVTTTVRRLLTPPDSDRRPSPGVTAPAPSRRRDVAHSRSVTR